MVFMVESRSFSAIVSKRETSWIPYLTHKHRQFKIATQKENDANEHTCIKDKIRLQSIEVLNYYIYIYIYIANRQKINLDYIVCLSERGIARIRVAVESDLFGSACVKKAPPNHYKTHSGDDPTNRAPCWLVRTGLEPGKNIAAPHGAGAGEIYCVNRSAGAGPHSIINSLLAARGGVHV